MVSLLLWFLRLFAPFRELEERCEQLEQRALSLEFAALNESNPFPGTPARVRAALETTLLKSLPLGLVGDVELPQRVEWLPHGRVVVRIYEGGGP